MPRIAHAKLIRMAVRSIAVVAPAVPAALGAGPEASAAAPRGRAVARSGCLLLVDVDGVLSLYGAARAEPGTLLGAQVDGVPHLLSRRAAAVLRELAASFECAWCTGWEERADEHLPGLLGLPRGWPHVTFPDAPALEAHWKLAGIDAFAGRRRPLAWIDDAHDDSCRAWAAARPAPTLLVTTEPDVGLTEAHAGALRAWLTRA